MSTDAAAAELLAFIEHQPDGDPAKLNLLAEAVMEAADEADPADVHAAAMRLASAFDDIPPDLAGPTGLLTGALIETGADAAQLTDPLLRLLDRVVTGAHAFVVACGDFAIAEEEDADRYDQLAEDEESLLLPDGSLVPPDDATTVARLMPEPAMLYGGLEQACLAAIAALTRHPAALAQARANTALVQRARELDLGFLAGLLQMLDEELIVIHVGERKGYRVHLDGVIDNMALASLLAGALIGDPADGLLPGDPPPPEVLACLRGNGPQECETSSRGVWNLYSWPALTTEQQLPDDPNDASEHWIWIEGIPADIEPLDGQRVILLGPPPYERTWKTARPFEALPSDLRLVAQLTDDETSGWLDRIAAAPR